ncbi:MAG: sigma-54 interaction domain-containing protein [Candidatus Binatia bacterium]
MEELIQLMRDKGTLANLVGEARVFLKAIENLPAMAKSDATVLICGETGTGKELVARAIHYLSDRAAYPFVPVNCGALPDSLLEDELFGHERGAFTDAQSRRAGLIGQSDRGTIFLDEVNSLTGRAQGALLRVLQEKTFRMLGGTQEHHADVRIVAATNAALDPLLKEKIFRTDLYYRLSVFTIHLPPLRDRKEDILVLASYFAKKHASPNKPVLQLSSAACERLVAYDWPGNVRELENAIIRGTQLSKSNTIEAEDLDLPTCSNRAFDLSVSVPSLDGPSFKEQKQKVIEEFERAYLLRLMTEHHGNVSRAAQAAGKERRDLGKLLKKYRVNPAHHAIPASRSS